MHLEGEDAAAGRLIGLAIIRLGGHHTIDVKRDFAPAGNDPIIVPLLKLPVLPQFGRIAEGGDLPLAVGSGDDFLSARRDDAPRVLINAAGVLILSVHVGLVTARVPIRQFAAAKLDAGIATLEPEPEPQLKIRRLPAAPDEVVVFRTRFLRRALRGDGAVLDPPPAGLALPAGEIMSVENGNEPGFLGGHAGTRQGEPEGNQDQRIDFFHDPGERG
jgi:hypothetical protein